ncbi:Photosystem I P700 chlorophyll a apoprotein A2 [Pseudodesulfovibrio hydrargyri]|uniref:Photosystem I P700 chlorophyll a apoprotein A2 n=1 Tax=Pseudodesulfovibrio hydrargyri TaxID=2125990 RepID=A0A1J5NEX0_9BACT|nr:OmpA family protein [Pseudodesulfovibrio hydrargyri]OIQ50273.1 Photosystem I P700 chlorophyll a apoprotein A2 [Pseudodesulfovibrio hydrargyri]
MKQYALILFVGLMLAGCGGGQTIVLLPDLDGHVGEVTVTSEGGQTATLNQANQAVTGTDKVTTLSDAQVQSQFGAAMAAQPEPTARFILHFHSDSTKLTDESKALIPDIIGSWKARVSRDVSVIGHTDTLGEKQYNYDLSVRRAKKVRELLVKAGMPEDIIEMTSHGEENPLIPTPDGKSEPRNRRVEVLVR